MDSAKKELATEEETINSLLKDPQTAANPSFQAFLSSKRAEIALKKDMLSVECSTTVTASPTHSISSFPPKRGPKSRYERTFDPDTTDVSSLSSSLENASFSFTTTGELFEVTSPFRMQQLKPKPELKRTEKRYQAPEPSSASQATTDDEKKPPRVPDLQRLSSSLSPREKHLLELYQREKARAEKERRKAQEKVLSMREKLVAEKERHLEQMMELMRAQAGLKPNYPQTTKDVEGTFSTSGSKELSRTTFCPSAIKKSEESAAWSQHNSAAFPHIPDSSRPSNKPDADESIHTYSRMISNDSEALRDEYEQNFESVILSEDLSEFSNTEEAHVSVPQYASPDRKLVGFQQHREELEAVLSGRKLQNAVRK